MHRSTAVALVLAAACVPAPAERAPGGAAGQPLAAADIASIRATDSSFAGAMEAGNPAAVAALYLPDAHLLPPNAAPVEGRDAIQQFVAGMLNAYQVTLTIGTDEIEGRGDLAYSRGHYVLAGRPKATGTPPLHDQGKFVEVLRRQPDGRWRYAVDMYSSNLPVSGSK
jgi:uncharacterized protein (TIGR02246 family)